jgi:hypothetical protein
VGFGRLEPSAFWRFTKVNAESYDRLGALVTTRSRATEGMPKTWLFTEEGGGFAGIEKEIGGRSVTINLRFSNK